MPKTLFVIPNHAFPGVRDPRTKIDRSRTTEKGKLGPFRAQNSAKKLRSGPDQKKIKKIPDQIGPSDPRTKRSVDPCLEVLLETVMRRPELIQILRSCTEV